jgi:hypothetical protein
MNFFRHLFDWFTGQRQSAARSTPAAVGQRPALEALEDRTTPAILGSQLPPSSLSGFVYCDNNHNGIFDPADTGIGGAVIALFRGSRMVGTTVTAADGSYRFNHLSAGTYTLIEGFVPPSATMVYSGSYDTIGSIRGESPSSFGQAIQPNILHTIHLGTGRNGINYNFAEICDPAFVPRPAISIIKFVDGQHVTAPPGQNKNGQQFVTFTYDVTNPGNVPLSNVTVTDTFSDNMGDSGSFNPTFTGGDTNGNGLLDPGEVWTYQAMNPPFVTTNGVLHYHNVVTVTGTAPNGAVVSASDQGFYFTTGSGT